MESDHRSGSVGARQHHVTGQQEQAERDEGQQLRREELEPALASGQQDPERSRRVLHTHEPRRHQQQQDARAHLERGSPNVQTAVEEGMRRSGQRVPLIRGAERQSDHAEEQDGHGQHHPVEPLLAQLQELSSNSPGEGRSGRPRLGGGLAAFAERGRGHRASLPVRSRKISSSDCWRSRITSGQCPWPARY